MQKPSFDKFAQSYEEILAKSLRTHGKDGDYYNRYKVQLVQNTCRRTPGAILDFGCGNGKNIALLQSAFPDATVEGCDISTESLEISRQSHPGVHFFTPGGHQAATMRYDLIFVANVLHHVPTNDRKAWMSDVKNMLKPGGEVILFEHNPLNPVVRRIVRSCPLDEDAVLVRPTELKALLAQCDMSLCSWGYTLFFPASLSWLSGLERWLRWIPLGAQYFVHARR